MFAVWAVEFRFNAFEAIGSIAMVAGGGVVLGASWLLRRLTIFAYRGDSDRRALADQIEELEVSVRRRTSRELPVGTDALAMLENKQQDALEASSQSRATDADASVSLDPSEVERIRHELTDVRFRSVERLADKEHAISHLGRRRRTLRWRATRWMGSGVGTIGLGVYASSTLFDPAAAALPTTGAGIAGSSLILAAATFGGLTFRRGLKIHEDADKVDELLSDVQLRGVRVLEDRKSPALSDRSESSDERPSRQ